MEFFGNAESAVRAGYRPCKLCHPLRAEALPPVVERLVARVRAAPPGAQRLTERDLRAMGIDPGTARRQFRRHMQMSFAAYQRSRRVAEALLPPAGSAIVRQQAAGFASASGFRSARQKLGEARLWSKQIATPLGPMIGICNHDGLCILDFLDRKGLGGVMDRLRKRAGTDGKLAAIVPGEHPHLRAMERQMAEYFAGTRKQFDLTLAPQGTEFQKRAWAYLRTIPWGETRTYWDEARALGIERAMRAVGRANGMNYLEIVIPCHRVVASSGELAGYGGGIARKRWLLGHERAP
jgi:AraC family transcriptional regulator of adaptative response/methylated-DNA-[protein]-cysteine methyltransferase